MKSKIIVSIFCFVAFVTNALAQTATSINIQDTRTVNDLPNFFGHGIRADFKQIATIGVPGEGYYSTNITIAPWNTSESSGGKNHQMNFNAGGLFYRNAFPTDQQWGAWRQVLMTSENGNLGIGTNNPTSSLMIRKSPGENDAHLFFGEPMSISGQPSSRLCFAGTGIQNANFTWVPNVNINEGKLFLSFGAYENGIKNPTKITFQSNGNVGIGTTSPAHKLDVIGTIRSREVKVDMNGADFVFEEKYPLMPLTELEAYVKKNKHLPEIATAKEMQEQGSNLGDLNTKLLQKIEELTLYVIEQNEKINILEKKMEKMESSSK